MASAAVLAAGLGHDVTVGMPARADTTAVVKARTPRTTNPDLSSQDGFYTVGQHLMLVCHIRDPLGPDCSPAAPDAVSQRANDAVAKANSAVGTDMFGPQGCGNFVAWSYGVTGLGAATAKEFRNKLAAQGRIHADQDFPRGALVFSENSLPGDLGHVDIAQGDGTFVSGGVQASYRGLEGAGHNVQVMNTYDPTPGARYLGWAEAPW